jgi:hypothetical protein
MHEGATITYLAQQICLSADAIGAHSSSAVSAHSVEIGYLSDDQAELLMEERADCPPLQLHAFEGFGELNLNKAQLLIHMPTLQRVDPRSIAADALHLLAHGLVDLRTLKINLDPRRVDRTMVYDWPMVHESLAACRQLIALTLLSTPLEELAALLRALPPSLRKLDILYCPGFVQSDAFFQCVAEGGLRQLQQLHVSLAFDEDESDPALNAAWLTRLDVCAPWITAVLREM